MFKRKVSPYVEIINLLKEQLAEERARNKELIDRLMAGSFETYQTLKDEEPSVTGVRFEDNTVMPEIGAITPFEGKPHEVG